MSHRRRSSAVGCHRHPNGCRHPCCRCPHESPGFELPSCSTVGPQKRQSERQQKRVWIACWRVELEFNDEFVSKESKRQLRKMYEASGNALLFVGLEANVFR